jgi:hypothetical protein
LDVLKHYAQTYGSYEFVESHNFQEFYQNALHDDKALAMFDQMKVLPHPKDQFSDLEWNLVGLYRTVVFRRKT